MKSLYMVVLTPTETLAREIRKLQREFAKQYGSGAALRHPVHITFCAPYLISDEEEFTRFQNDLSGIAGKFKSFEIELCDFGFFLKNRVLFIGVTENSTLHEMHHSFNMFLKKPDKRPYHPHITIGYRNLLPGTFMKIIEEYQSIHFYAKFTVYSLHLWHHENGIWKTIESYPLAQTS